MGEEGVWLAYLSGSLSIIEAVRPGTEAGAGAGTVDKLACFLAQVQQHFSHLPRPPVQGYTHSGIGPPTSINIQENDPQTCLPSDGDIS